MEEVHFPPLTDFSLSFRFISMPFDVCGGVNKVDAIARPPPFPRPLFPPFLQFPFLFFFLSEEGVAQLR